MSPTVVLVLPFGILVAHYFHERRVVRRFALGATRGERSPGRAALALATVIHQRIPRNNDHVFLGLGVPALLGPTPVDVIHRGGGCSSLARLYVLGLRSLGIRAMPVTLYHESGVARHALVEVRIGTDRWIVDPAYGFHYVDHAGRPIGLDALRAGTEPEFRPLVADCEAGYPRTNYHTFDYRRSKTANWTMTLVRRVIYPPLRMLTSGRIDTMPQPGFLEWPQLIIAGGILAVLLCLWV